jgi:hypothetical protein
VGACSADAVPCGVNCPVPWSIRKLEIAGCVRCPTYKTRRSGLIDSTEAARDRRFGLPRNLAGIGPDVEGDDLVLILQANVKRAWHDFPSLVSDPV